MNASRDSPGLRSPISPTKRQLPIPLPDGWVSGFVSINHAHLLRHPQLLCGGGKRRINPGLVAVNDDDILAVTSDQPAQNSRCQFTAFPARVSGYHDARPHGIEDSRPASSHVRIVAVKQTGDADHASESCTDTLQARTDRSRTAFRWKSRYPFWPLVKPPTLTTLLVSMPMR